MKMVIPDEGKLLWLSWALCDAVAALEDFTLMLFKNNETVDDDSVFADFTPADFDGYDDVIITRADMGSPVIIAHVAYAECAFVPTFECTNGTGQLIFGWIMFGNTSGKVLAGQNFDLPRDMTTGASELLDPFRIGLKTFT